MFSKEEMAEIRQAQAKNKKVQKGLFMTLEDLRFATNNQVARYRAKRLACDTLVEIGCSIGAQTIEFAKTCKKVIAVDVDERKIRFAKANLEKFGIKNVELLCKDGLKLDIKKADIIFCDPERLPGEEKRELNAFKPDIYKLVKKYSKTTKDFCIEIPPHTQEIKLDCEKEYVSVGGELNRLDLYLGGLKGAEASAVLLPGTSRLEGTPGVPKLTSTDAGKYLYEIDEAVVKAQLTDALAQMLDEDVTLFKDDFKFLTSDKSITSPFFKNSFKVLANVKDDKEVIPELKKKKCGQVVLRQNIDPKKYWAQRKVYEKELSGKKIVHLIVTTTSFLICEKLSSPAQAKS